VLTSVVYARQARMLLLISRVSGMQLMVQQLASVVPLVHISMPLRFRVSFAHSGSSAVCLQVHVRVVTPEATAPADLQHAASALQARSPRQLGRENASVVRLASIQTPREPPVWTALLANSLKVRLPRVRRARLGSIQLLVSLVAANASLGNTVILRCQLCLHRRLLSAMASPLRRVLVVLSPLDRVPTTT
jgi:hypothetical protein